jgi:hypothetical protein
VVVRAIGSDLHMDYTAVGQTTHLAARMEQLAEPGSILLSPATLEAGGRLRRGQPLGPVPVKGLPAPVEVCELVGAGAVRSRLHAAAARGLTRFVGRDSEVDQLRQAWSGPRPGTARSSGGRRARRRQVPALLGVHPLPSRHGWLILESGSVSYGKATAYLPSSICSRRTFHIEGRDETRTIARR